MAGRFSDLEMTWLLYCAGAATGFLIVVRHFHTSVISYMLQWLTLLVKLLTTFKFL